MTLEELPPAEVTLAQVLAGVKVPWPRAGAFLMALAYTCEQYGYVYVAETIRDQAISIVDEVTARGA